MADTAPLVGEATEVRVSPDRHKVARQVPAQFVRDDDPHQWLAVYFVEHVGLTVELLTDDDVSTWLSWTG